jgi:transcriptional regulator with XRE-family HTH domain
VPAKSIKSAKHEPARVVFGIALRKARIERGLSQEQLALEAGIHRTYVTEVEAGKRNVAIDNLERLADAVGLPLWEMLRR